MVFTRHHLIEALQNNIETDEYMSLYFNGIRLDIPVGPV